MRILALLLIATHAYAVRPCDVLGFLAGEADAEASLPLIIRTYRELLTTLGGRMTTEVMDHVVRSKDPFSLPADAAHSDALARHLAELKRLLEVRGWNTEPVRQALVTELSRRRDSAERADEERESTVQETHRPYSVSLPHA